MSRWFEPYPHSIIPCLGPLTSVLHSTQPANTKYPPSRGTNDPCHPEVSQCCGKRADAASSGNSKARRHSSEMAGLFGGQISLWASQWFTWSSAVWSWLPQELPCYSKIPSPPAQMCPHMIQVRKFPANPSATGVQRPGLFWVTQYIFSVQQGSWHLECIQ